MNPFSILVRPINSEKSVNLRDSKNKYVFRVNLKATKADVKKAIEATFNVLVEGVQTSVIRGKVRRRGAHVVKGSNWKKAVVTLPKGSKIGLFEVK